MTPRPGRHRNRPGTALLEIQVAIVVLGIALVGACPLIVMQMKLLRRFEAKGTGPSAPPRVLGQRLVDGVPAVPAGQDAAPPVTVIHPHPDRWVRRLGGAATLDDRVGGPPPAPLPAEQTLQEADAARLGTWAPGPADGAAGGGSALLEPGEAEGSATWTFAAIPPARYRVLLAWPAAVPIPADAAVTATAPDPGSEPVVVPIGLNTLARVGGWLDLGNLALGPGSALRLDRSKVGAVVADAVRIGVRHRVTVAEAPPADLGPDDGLSARFGVAARP